MIFLLLITALTSAFGHIQWSTDTTTLRYQSQIENSVIMLLYSYSLDESIGIPDENLSFSLVEITSTPSTTFPISIKLTVATLQSSLSSYNHSCSNIHQCKSGLTCVHNICTCPKGKLLWIKNRCISRLAAIVCKSFFLYHSKFYFLIFVRTKVFKRYLMGHRVLTQSAIICYSIIKL